MARDEVVIPVLGTAAAKGSFFSTLLGENDCPWTFSDVPIRVTHSASKPILRITNAGEWNMAADMFRYNLTRKGLPRELPRPQERPDEGGFVDLDTHSAMYALQEEMRSGEVVVEEEVSGATAILRTLALCDSLTQLLRINEMPSPLDSYEKKRSMQVNGQRKMNSTHEGLPCLSAKFAGLEAGDTKVDESLTFYCIPETAGAGEGYRRGCSTDGIQSVSQSCVLCLYHQMVTESASADVRKLMDEMNMKIMPVSKLIVIVTTPEGEDLVGKENFFAKYVHRECRVSLYTTAEEAVLGLRELTIQSQDEELLEQSEILLRVMVELRHNFDHSVDVATRALMDYYQERRWKEAETTRQMSREGARRVANFRLFLAGMPMKLKSAVKKALSSHADDALNAVSRHLDDIQQWSTPEILYSFFLSAQARRELLGATFWSQCALTCVTEAVQVIQAETMDRIWSECRAAMECILVMPQQARMANACPIWVCTRG